MLARAVTLSLLFGALCASGCDRLNPDWCEEKASCATDEYCDPRTNTCRPREAGLTPDTAPATVESGADLPLDAAPDLPVTPDLHLESAPAPDQQPPDLPPKTDLPPPG
jgi:hypothetical protein